MSSWKFRVTRFALVISCLAALSGLQLIRPTSSEAGAGSSPPSAARIASPTKKSIRFFNKVKPDDVITLAPEVSACIAGTLSAGSATFNRPSVVSLGTGIGSGSPGPCVLSPTATVARFNVYQFNITGCTSAQVTITLCGGAIGGSGCATASNTDTVILIYRSGGLTAGTGAINPFNPSSACTNVVAANDDLNGVSVTAGGSSCDGATCLPACTGNTSTSGLIRTLGPGFFEVVVTGFSNTTVGNYNLFVSTTSAGCAINAPTAVKLESINVTRYEGGVEVDWKTGHEVDNLGFNVYRDGGGKHTRLTPQMVAGSALLAGPGTTLGAGQSYSWVDTQSRDKNAQYWLEEIDLNGQSTWHGPVGVSEAGNRAIPPPRRGRGTLLSALGASSKRPSSFPLQARATLPETSQSRMRVQAGLASSHAVKLSVREEGLYRVLQPDLVRAGLDPNVDPRRLQLYVDGQQVPIAEVNTANGRFDSSSAIEFYGTGIDSASTDTRVYWLMAGSEPGLRISQAAGKVKAGKSSASSFPYTVERRDRTVYFSALRNGDRENFFGAVIAQDPADQRLSLQSLDQTASEATLDVALQGVSQVQHRVEVQVNGARAGEVIFANRAEGVSRFPIPQALLKEGENTVTLVRQGEPSDVSLVDYIRITYQRRFTADDDALKFTVNGKRAVTVDGFSNADIRAFDVTDPNNVQELSGKVKQRGAGYSVTISAPGNSQRTLLALANGRARTPSAIAVSRGVNLRQEEPGADLVIITRRDFFDGLSPLVALRQSQGLSVAVVDVEAIYDSFSFGHRTPQAIKDFLTFARAGYKTAPRYVLIVGDASLDPKDYLGFGDNDITPTRLVDTRLMETASDDWFVESTGMAIGRLPVSTAEEAATIVAKIVSYDFSVASQEVLLVADSNDEQDFEQASAQLRALIPQDLAVERINRGRDGDAIAKTRLLNALMRGQKVVNYVGHGSVDQWKASLLTTADIGEIQSQGSPPFFVMLTCLNGYFQDASLDSLAESLVKAEKGAIAVWASSGMTTPDAQRPASSELYRSLFDESNPSVRLGEAVGRAKAAAKDADVRRTWILFGDPTMKLR